MYAHLNSPYALRGWKDLPYGVTDTLRGGVRRLSAEGGALCEYLDGEIDLSLVILTPGQQKILDEAVEKGVVSLSEHNRPIEDWQKRRESSGHFLRSIHWSITGGCNLACKHCYMSAPHNRYADLDTSECLSIIKQFVQANVTSVSISGGEPFTRKDFWQIVDALASEHIPVTALFTNGLLVTDDVFDALEKRNMHPEFYISFDGLGRHEWMRGGGTEEKTLAVLKRVLEKGYRLSVETAVHSGNIDVFRDTYELMKSLGVHGWKVSSLYESGEWTENKNEALSLETHLAAYMDMMDLYMKDGQPMLIQLDGFFMGSAAGSRSVPYLGDMSGDPLRRHSCLFCRTQPNLLPDGRLIPCPPMNGTCVEKDMPNLLETPLVEVYSRIENNFFRLVERRAADIIQLNEECRSCDYRIECKGGCRGLALLNGNGVTGRDPIACRFFKEGYRKRVYELCGV
ncbi:MAG: radical SAM protein [Spirochaetales bacterium]|jgi:radical SAM protein with 4Fe4S-binding SPASM domain|nr:radical SAM protein [Spirochaetales bacterium]